MQQILFFHELGIELKVIKKILNQSGFDQLGALTNHRAYLEKKLKQTEQLLVTIDSTINQLKGKGSMKHKENKQAHYGVQIKLGIFKMLPYTQGTFTTDIIERVRAR